jgi:predicted DsbA family dithiol-disulfide isomerase
MANDEPYAPLLAERKGRVRLVVRHVPLRRHPDARGAARAAICAESLAPDPNAYFHALSQAPDLSEAACAELASSHGVDRERFDRCVRDPATDRRVDEDGARFDAALGDGVPLLFVGATRLEGAQTRSTLEPALDEAIAAER